MRGTFLRSPMPPVPDLLLAGGYTDPVAQATECLSDLDDWCTLGAREKALSVVTLAADLGIRDVLEIGCGTGAVLAELDDLAFGDRYWAGTMQYSSSGGSSSKRTGATRCSGDRLSPRPTGTQRSGRGKGRLLDPRTLRRNRPQGVLWP